MNSRLNIRLAITNLRPHETPFLGVHETGSSSRAYFGLTGGLERWLYRLVRKHAGSQQGGWSFDFAHLHAKSGALSPLKHFAFDLRDIVRRQPIPNYRLDIRRGPFDRELLVFAPLTTDPLERAVQRLDRRLAAVEKL